LLPPRVNIESAPEMWTAARINFDHGEPQQRGVPRDRPPEAGSRRRAGATAGGPDRRGPAPAFRDQADRRPVLPRDSDVRRSGRRRASHDRVADGRGRVRAADRVRECREPARRARVGAQPRARSPRRHRRQAAGSSCARCWRRAWSSPRSGRAGTGARSRGHPGADSAGAQGLAAARRGGDGSRRPGLRGVCRRADRDGLRDHPGAARVAYRRDGSACDRRAVGRAVCAAAGACGAPSWSPRSPCRSSC